MSIRLIKQKMWRLQFSVISIFILIFQSACTDKIENKQIDLAGHTMGTQYHILLLIPAGHKISPSVKNSIDDLLAEINQQMSTYISDSLINQFNHYEKTDWFRVTDEFFAVISTAQKISQETDGDFDISIAPLVDLWGFGAEVKYKMPSQKQIKKMLQHTGYQKIKLRKTPPSIRKEDRLISIDLSAIAKGYAVDQISNYLKSQGYKNHLVEIGGEIRSSGHNKWGKKWQIIIKQATLNRAAQRNKKPTVLEISDLSVATSGDYQNYFVKDGKRYSHTIDPKTGAPTSHKLASVTVLNKTAAIADAYATALLVMGEVQAKAFAFQHKLQVHMFIRADGAYESWSNIPDLK